MSEVENFHEFRRQLPATSSQFTGFRLRTIAYWYPTRLSYWQLATRYCPLTR